jgi:hypothetical protein
MREYEAKDDSLQRPGTGRRHTSRSHLVLRTSLSIKAGEEVNFLELTSRVRYRMEKLIKASQGALAKISNRTRKEALNDLAQIAQKSIDVIIPKSLNSVEELSEIIMSSRVLEEWEASLWSRICTKNTDITRKSHTIRFDELLNLSDDYLIKRLGEDSFESFLLGIKRQEW